MMEDRALALDLKLAVFVVSKRLVIMGRDGQLTSLTSPTKLTHLACAHTATSELAPQELPPL